MKANELMIGDWVYRNSYSKNPMRVTLIDEGGCYLTFEGNEGDPFDGDFGENGIQPIPLTDEILEANGWHRNDKHSENLRNAKFIANKCLLGLDSEPFEVGYTVYLDELETILIDYVHEFQNLLRLCGYCKLADNFKIEKEEEV